MISVAVGFPLAFGAQADTEAPSALDPLFNHGPLINGSVFSILQQSDGKILIGGDFTKVNGAVRNGIARLESDGRLDTAFGNGMAGANGTVLSVAVQPDGKILIGGWFSAVNGMERNRIARLNADGTLDGAFPNGPLDIFVIATPFFHEHSFIRSVAVQPDGKILIGGAFFQVNGLARGSIARLHADGTLDTAFGPGLGGTGIHVFSIAVQTDGKILVGALRTTVESVARKGILRLNADGTFDTDFASGQSGANTFVLTLAIQPDGKIVIGGNFEFVNFRARKGIARLNRDGTLDDSFGKDLAGANLRVRSVAVGSDGKILIGGDFTTVNGEQRTRIARLNTDGTLDTEFDSSLSGANGIVRSVTVQPDGRILIGGDFTTVNGVGRDRVARLVGTVTLPRLVNLSARAIARRGEETLIVGFVISGTGPKTVIIRGVGPKLLSYGVPNVVADPALVLYSGLNPIAQNNDWSSSLAADFTTVGAFALDPGSKDAAMKVTLNPGAYTIHLVNTGPLAEALVEVYDFSKDAGSRLVNLSSRSSIAAGETAIVGTVIGAPGAVVVRNVGPELKTYGVLGFHSDPVLRVFSGQTVIATNDDWDALLAPYFQAVGAFPLTSGSKDAASRVLLNPGAYTVHATGNGAPGIVLVELYESP